jgi:hypothetical protein
MTSIGAVVQKLEPWTLLVGTWKGTAGMENNSLVPQKIKNTITTWFSNSTFEYIAKRIQSRVFEILYTYVIKTLFIILKCTNSLMSIKKINKQNDI